MTLPPPLPRPAAVALAVAGGVLLALASPPHGLALLAPAGVAALLGAVHRRRPLAATALTLVLGLVWSLGLLVWLRAVGSDVWVGVAGAEALLLAPTGAGIALAARLPGGWVWAPAVWVADEALRARVPLGGFAWGRLAFTQGRTPLTPFAALGGAPLVSAAVVGVAVAALGLLLGGPSRLRRAGSLAALVAVLGCSRAVPLPTAGERRGGAPDAAVALVQGNVPRLGLDFLGQRRAVLDNHTRQTRVLAEAIATGRAPRPDAVLWPENASDLDPYTDPQARAEISAAVREVGAPTLVGAVVDDPADPAHYVQNRGIVWDPVRGPGASYAKRHLVPFGEYVPARGWLTPVAARLQRIPRDFRPGRSRGVLDVGPVRAGDVICFEVADDGVERDVVRGGARLLVVQTNNATYGRRGETEQQLAMSQLRAVEHGRAVLVVATSGISAVVAPDGRVLQRTAEFAPAVVSARVPLRDARTPADRVGPAPELVLAGLGLLAALGGLARRPFPPARPTRGTPPARRVRRRRTAGGRLHVLRQDART